LSETFLTAAVSVTVWFFWATSGLSEAATWNPFAVVVPVVAEAEATPNASSARRVAPAVSIRLLRAA
jgi:hypothetical protein